MSENLRDLSENLAAVVARAAPSVVRVESRRRGGASGVAWSPDAIVTAHHAVEWDEPIWVGLPDGSMVTVTLAGRDPATDLALLSLAGGGLAPPEWSEAPDLSVGHLVLGLCRPGRSVRASFGIVSALADSWRAPAGGRLDRYLQTGLPLQRGFSGSLLVDATGRALGVNTSGLLRGASLAVPTATVRRVVESLRRRGSVRRGYLGIGTYPVPLPSRLEGELGQASGLLVLSVASESPAEAAGLLFADTLVSLGGHPVGSASDLVALLDEESVGRRETARIVRAGGVLEIPVTVGGRGAGSPPSP